jgi:hypothetical protein
VAPAPAPALETEIDALAAVRAAIVRGDPRAALEKLDAFGGAFPNAALADEAMVLRVDALASLGDRVAAATLAHRFLASNSSSPHAPHLRAVVAGAHNP